ncbi:MAG: AAA family ATPase [Chitinophagaceae bacterium]|nr:MAG: AAA family ATPase [Chitinophagaceae bacterium]
MKKSVVSQLLSKIFQRFFASKQPQPAYDEIVRTSAEDARLAVPSHIKETLYALMNTKEEQQPGFNYALHITLNHADAKVNLQTARWVAAQQQRNIYRVKLSGLVGKYIGETEKNIDQIFYKAENNNLVLLFDEADALFGKRSTVKDAHDRYANLEISYLQKSIRSFKGTVLINCETQHCREWQPIDFVRIAE